jgi:hypothetical protein
VFRSKQSFVFFVGTEAATFPAELLGKQRTEANSENTALLGFSKK